MEGCLLYIVLNIIWFIIRGIFGGLSNLFNNHKIRKANDERETLFIKYMATMSAKIAKADGNVSEVEIRSVNDAFRRLGLSEEKTSICREYFKRGLDSHISINNTAAEFARKFPENEIRSLMYQVLAYIALADEWISKEELTILRELPANLRISRDFFFSFCSGAEIDPNASKDQKVGSFREGAGVDPYEILGVSKTASNDEIKKVYREKIKKYHPDILRGQGVPEEMLKFANEEMAKLNNAYEAIKKERRI